MEKTDFQTFYVWLKKLEKVLPHPPTASSKIDRETAQFYFFALKDFSLDEVKAAFAHALKNCRYFPRPAEIREFITGKQSSDSVQAEIAWAAVVEAVRKIGAYRSVLFDDPAVAMSIRFAAESWPKLCSKEKKELEDKIRPKFKRIYSFYASKSGVKPFVLPGLEEIDIVKGGWKGKHPLPRPVLILTGSRLDREQMEELKKLVQKRKAIAFQSSVCPQTSAPALSCSSPRLPLKSR